MTTPMLRTSERTAWKRCPQKWHWAYRQGLQRKGLGSPNALWFGTGIHLALARWYCGPGDKRGPHPAETFKDFVGDETRRMRNAPNAEEWDEQEFIDAKDLGVGMLDRYVNRYGIDGNWDIIAPEKTFQLDIPRPGIESLTRSGTLVTYVGTYDLVYRDLAIPGEPILLGEHKTASAIQTGHLPLDDQAGAYWASASMVLRHEGFLEEKDSIEGINYNFLRKSVPDKRPVNSDGMKLNKDGSVSKVQPPAFFLREVVWRDPREVSMQIKNIQNEALHMEQIKFGVLPLYKTPTRNCQWDCSFFDMCQLHETGDDWQEYRDALYVKQDPYLDHRKSAADE